MSVENRDKAPPAPSLTGKQRFICGNCLHEKSLLPGDAPETIRTGCRNCQRITHHLALGSVAFHMYCQAKGGDPYVR